jgi:hypothetical protein
LGLVAFVVGVVVVFAAQVTVTGSVPFVAHWASASFGASSAAS